MASANALELTTDNFAEMTAGKTVFLKFYAPWCGHCKAMAGDWAKLEKDFEGHKVAFVASVDCTAEDNDELCQSFNVEGFPTLAWGDATAAESYEGQRDYDSLKAFADKHITKPVCSITNLDVCSAEEKAEITAVEAKTDDELLEAALKIVQLTKAEERKFEDFLELLQTQYAEEDAKHQNTIAKIKEDGKFKYISQVFAKRGLPNPMNSIDLDMEDDDDDDLDLEDDLAGEL